MNRRNKTLLIAATLCAVAACKLDDDRSTPQTDASFKPRHSTWVEIMENIMERNYYDVLSPEAKKGAGNMDLTAISKAAEECANYVALGYGIHRDPSVAEFADIARLTESWLREISAQARAGRETGLAALIIEGEATHCDRCHDAVSK